MKKKKLLIFSLFTILSLTSCGDPFASHLHTNPLDDGGIDTPWVENDNGVRIAKINLSETSKALKVGESFTLNASYEPNNAYNKKLTWRNSNPEVASLEDGQITALSNGETVITVCSDNNITSSCQVTVTTPLESIAINVIGEKLMMGINETRQLSVACTPETASNKTVSWSLENVPDIIEDYVSLSSSGLLSINLPRLEEDQTFDIVASSMENPEITDRISVVIHDSNVYATKVELDQTGTVNLEVNKKATIKATAYKDSEVLSDKHFTWTSSAPEIVNVTDGEITALKVSDQKVTITAEVDGLSASVLVQTYKVAVTSIETKIDSINLLKGESVSIGANVLPEEASVKTVKYLLSDGLDKCISVSSTGLVTALASTPIGGEYKVTVVSDDNNEIKKELMVEVTNPITSLKVTSDRSIIYYGTTDHIARLSVEITPKDADVGTYTFKSSDESLATVNNSGVVTANNNKKVGKVVITVTSTANPAISDSVEIEVAKPLGKFEADSYYLVGNKDFSKDPISEEHVSWSDSDYAKKLTAVEKPGEYYEEEYYVAINLTANTEYKVRTDEWLKTIDLVLNPSSNNEGLRKAEEGNDNFYVDKDGLYHIYFQVVKDEYINATDKGISFKTKHALFVTREKTQDDFLKGNYYVVGDHDFSTGISKEGASWNHATKANLMAVNPDNENERVTEITFNKGDNFRIRSVVYWPTSLDTSSYEDCVEKSGDNYLLLKNCTLKLYYKINENSLYAELVPTAQDFVKGTYYVCGTGNYKSGISVPGDASWNDASKSFVMSKSSDTQQYARVTFKKGDEFRIRTNVYKDPTYEEQYSATDCVKKENNNFVVLKDCVVDLYYKLDSNSLYVGNADVFKSDKYYVVGNKNFSSGVSQDGESWGLASKAFMMDNYETGKWHARISFKANDEFKIRNNDWPTITLGTTSLSEYIEQPQEKDNFKIKKDCSLDIYYVINESKIYLALVE